MYPALLLAAIFGATTAHGLPFVEWNTFPGGLPIQPFGVIVALGVILGVEVCRRYSVRFGIDDDDHRAVMGCVIITGFIGAHVFDVLAYQQDKLAKDPIILLKLWDGISSYGGFLGGGLGIAFYLWWKRLTVGLWVDVAGVGLLLAFSIGRIACTLVHDHIGAATTSQFGVDYPWAELVGRGLDSEFVRAPIVRAHNLGMYELAYLIPVNLLVLGLAFSKRRWPAGFLAVVIGVLYAPVRFFLEFWRLDQSDPRYLGMTFAQWCSIAGFALAVTAAVVLLRKGQRAPLTAELGGRQGGRRASLDALRASKST